MSATSSSTWRTTSSGRPDFSPSSPARSRASRNSATKAGSVGWIGCCSTASTTTTSMCPARSAYWSAAARFSPCSTSWTPPSPRCTWPIRAIVPIPYNRAGDTVSTFSRCATAKISRDSVLSAASMARSVAGRPAPTGVVTPGNSTMSRNGRTGRVSRSDIPYHLREKSHFESRFSISRATIQNDLVSTDVPLSPRQ